MKTGTQEFEVLIPNLDGAGVAERVKVSVPVRWDEDLQEWLLTPEAHELIENTKARHLGLMLPDEIREIRERLDLTQDEICELLQIGAKTYTRWETGRARPSRSMNVLLCALRDGVASVEYLRSLREGTDWEVIRSWRQHPRLNFWEGSTGRTPAPPVSRRGEGGRWFIHVHAGHGKTALLAEMASMFDTLLQERTYPSARPQLLNEPTTRYQSRFSRLQSFETALGSFEPPRAA
ncbi:MAG: helix-turn-helix domain-containing protein [Verrucomicrobia bacterium]|nr:helix-turn-helix domain-containing protein [Verrucomicrobiota bacterium]